MQPIFKTSFYFLLIYIIILIFIGPFSPLYSQEMYGDDNMEGIKIGADIFNDFNDDIEASKILEDERFYRYGRFFSFELSVGMTSFDGNRGAAYENELPSYGLGLYYFSDFNTSFGLGFSMSKHHFEIDLPVYGFEEPVGLVSVNMLRFWFGTRFYIDTSNLITAITYANPYFIGRIEYWYVSSKYLDQDQTIFSPDSGGGFGFSAGAGLEFPITIKEVYLGIEGLYHVVNFHDKYTQRYAPITGGGFGYDDLSGNSFTIMTSLTQTW